MNMKNLIKPTVGLVLGCVVLLTTMTAWAVKPAKYVAEPVPSTDVPMFDCSFFGMEFGVMGEWITNEYGQFHFDKKGNLVKINGFIYLTEQRVWNSTDSSKDLTEEDVAGKAEHSHFILNFDEHEVPTQYKESGVFTKMVVPGYGQIRLNAGRILLVPDGPENWILVSSTPNTNPTIEDAYALCVYLE
jgi:hypothetical protein